jgi:DNA repair protein RecO (recombination protein O)
MSQQQVTTGIVLARVDYGEADRILTLITPDQGKLRLMAKGVRKIKSKLAGGIELFSVSDITFMHGRGEIGRLISSRLITHFSSIVTNLDRTMAGYDFIKQLNRATEDEPEPEYFELLEQTFVALNDPSISLDLIHLWFAAQLLQLGGHAPNLHTELNGGKLEAGQRYEFSFDDSGFTARPDAPYGADAIKFLRLVFSGNPPAALARVAGVDTLVAQTKQLVSLFAQQYTR